MDWLASVPSWLAALPWLLAPLVVVFRLARSRDLATYPPVNGPDAPLVTVIVPARNEAHNIAHCVRSLAATTYEQVEIIVVDDHSTDGTGDIARSAAATDARIRVVSPPPLPDGWFGKQWACAHGASMAKGAIVVFTDADTRHAPELLARSVRALMDRNADLLSVLGRQDLVTVWERLIQPVVFAGLLGWYGGTEPLSRSTNPRRKIANGQFLMMRRATYDEMGGHETVRQYAAEDLMFAQVWTSAGRQVHLVTGLDFLTTRMYTSLREIIDGWAKNAWTAGRYLFPDNAIVRTLARCALPFSPLFGAVPLIAIALAAIAGEWWLTFGLFAWVGQTAGVSVLLSGQRQSALAAALWPIGSLMASYIFALAAIRGDRTIWKGRAYTVR